MILNKYVNWIIIISKHERVQFLYSAATSYNMVSGEMILFVLYQLFTYYTPEIPLSRDTARIRLILWISANKNFKRTHIPLTMPGNRYNFLVSRLYKH